MFRRRIPLPIHRRIKEVLWPSLGWFRAARYVGHRLGRLPGSPYRIAAGFACGAAVSFTPFIGFHFVLAAGLSLLLRGNLIASAIGTAVGNPWTFPLIWTWTFHFGRWLLGEAGRTSIYPERMTLTFIFDHPWQVLLPMTLGGLITGVVAWFAFYWPARSVVTQYQKARHWRLRRKLRHRDFHIDGAEAAEPVAAVAAGKAAENGGRLQDAPAAGEADGTLRKQRRGAAASDGGDGAQLQGETEQR